MTISESLADIVLEVEFERIPSDAVLSATKLLLDHFCVAVVGAGTPWGRTVSSFGRQLGGMAESSVYFTCDKLPAPQAAFINGTLAHGFELDDHVASVHAGAVVIPAAIAAGESRGAGGRTIIAGMISGYEVLYRLSKAVGPISSTGHHATGTLGALGAAAAAGTVMGLEKGPLVSALGLAGNFATGVAEFYRGGMEKRLFAGRCAESGVLACLLAEAGVTGAPTILEGEFGFCRSFSRDLNLDRILEGPGPQFYINRTRVKCYPCAGPVHPYVQAALSLHKDHPEIFDRPGDVAAIVIESRKPDRRRAGLDIRDVLSAQYSTPYAVAAVLRYGEATPQAFSEEAINDPAVAGLLQRCESRGNEHYPGVGRVMVRLKDGTALAAEAVDPERHVTEIDRGDIAEKALSMIGAAMGADRARDIVGGLDKVVDRIVDAGDIREVMQTLPMLD
ncbi:MAG: MmgE/PrpD family protein [Chloroflexi bacterium]|nr:MmgE/PrpD family protein [Chloroflexota bacterium]